MTLLLGHEVYKIDRKKKNFHEPVNDKKKLGISKVELPKRHKNH